jgi:hypothetical protein
MEGIHDFASKISPSVTPSPNLRKKVETCVSKLYNTESYMSDSDITTHEIGVFTEEGDCGAGCIPLNAGSMGLLLKTAKHFVIVKTVCFNSCNTDRLSRMLCCTELVGSGKVNKTGFRSLSRYKRFILSFFFLWRSGPFRVMASLYTV